MDEDAGLRQPLSEEQKSRICQSFRAAKALLTRKRPLSNDQTPLACKPVKLFQDQQFDDSTRRVPLAQVSPNSLTYYHGGAVQTVEECSKPLPSVRRNKFLANYSRPRMVDIYKGDVLAPYTPKSQQCSSLLNLPSGDQLDDYLDDSVLEQIDALCGQRRNSLSGIDSSSANTIMAGSLLMDEYIEENISKSILITDQKFPRNENTLNLEVVNPSADKILSISGAVQGETIKVEYRDYIQKLNTRQQEAVYGDINIPLMIVAGPGSGKTSTMVGRVLRLLSEGMRPSNILAMTFTIAAASEMRARVGAVAGKSIAKEITMSTFHSFSLHLCRSHAEKLNRTSEFLIYGHGQQRRAIIEAVRLHENRKGAMDPGRNESNTGHDDKDRDGIQSPVRFPEKSKRWQKFVTQAKASGKLPSDYLKQGDTAGGEILQNYGDILESCNALDYHDLISCSLRLLTDFPEVFSESQESWKALVVDEFQDTSTMQYGLLRTLASHNRITIVGDEDQSIFSFNGADVSGFESFRKDFPNYKEVRLNKNYRSTKCIVEASAHLIRNNYRRCSTEAVQTDNCFGSKVIVKECHSEDGQCSFVIDKILEFMSNGDSGSNASFGSVAVLYRRQVCGKIFQTAFRNRKIPFNIHGVAFYRKKAVKSIVSLLKTPLPGCDDRAFRQATKALLPLEKEEVKRVIDHVDKVLTVRKCDFMTAASDIFNAKISGTFKRSELTKGRKVLSSLDMISRMVKREESISTVISFVAGLLPQKCVLDQRAVVDVDGGKLLNEDLDARSVLQYLLDDASDFLSLRASGMDHSRDEQKGCMSVLKSFIDYISERERDNFVARRRDNKDSVTLTTIHQSKGLEWDTVFIVKANDSEIPLLPEAHCGYEPSASIEEERRLFYVAMTRARRKLLILYQIVDSNWKMLQPSRFLKELPDHLKELQADSSSKEDLRRRHGASVPVPQEMKETGRRTAFPAEEDEGSCNFLARFCVEDRQIVSHLFRKWAKKGAFKDPKRLIDKIGFAIDERMRMKKSATRDVLQSLKACLNTDSALGYAEYVLRWEEIPAERRAQIMKEKEEHFQKLRVQTAMSSSEPTPKQLSFLKSLGCTVIPVSRLHASHLIEQYKSL